MIDNIIIKCSRYNYYLSV